MNQNWLISPYGIMNKRKEVPDALTKMHDIALYCQNITWLFVTNYDYVIFVITDSKFDTWESPWSVCSATVNMDYLNCSL